MTKNRESFLRKKFTKILLYINSLNFKTKNKYNWILNSDTKDY